MATDELTASMPDLEAIEGIVFKFEAIDASTGAVVAGVNITDATIYGDAPDPVAPAVADPVPPLLAYVPMPDAA